MSTLETSPHTAHGCVCEEQSGQSQSPSGAVSMSRHSMCQLRRHGPSHMSRCPGCPSHFGRARELQASRAQPVVVIGRGVILGCASMNSTSGLILRCSLLVRVVAARVLASSPSSASRPRQRAVGRRPLPRGMASGEDAAEPRFKLEGHQGEDLKLLEHEAQARRRRGRLRRAVRDASHARARGRPARGARTRGGQRCAPRARARGRARACARTVR